MKSFKNFSDLHEKKKDLNPIQQGVLGLGDLVKKGYRSVVPEPSKSNEPSVRDRRRTNKTGDLLGRYPDKFHAPSYNKAGQQVDGKTDPKAARTAPPKRTKKDDEITAKNQSDRQTLGQRPDKFFGTGLPKAKTDDKTKKLKSPGEDPKHRFWSSSPTMNPDKKPPGGDKKPPTVKPQKPSAKDDPRNAQYKKMRDDLNATTFQSKKDKEGATKATEKIGKDAWAKANPAAAAAEKKRKASKNPLMKRFGDRDARKKELAKIRRDAKDASIAQSPNAEKIKKKETAIRDNIKSSMKRQALGDRAKAKQGLDPSKPTPKDQLPKGAQQARTGVPKTDTPAVKKPPAVVPANTGSGRTGGFGAGTFGKGMPSNPPVRATTPPPTAQSTVKIGDKVGYSKGGEVKKKTKKESFLGFADYLAEKKTKIKLNPKKDDLLEGGCGSYSKGGDVKKNHGEDCDCMKCEKKRRKDDLGDEKTVSTEGYAYVSQEEVSEEGYQEGNQTETDLTEASFEIGPGHRGAMRGKKIYDKGKGTTNPHEKDAFLKRTGPQLPLAKGKKSLETAGYEPETEGEQLDEISADMLKGMGKGVRQTIKPGGSNALGVKSDATSAGGGKYFTNNARLLARNPASYVRGMVPEPPKTANAAAKPAGPKPNPMQANRPGMDGKGISTSVPKSSINTSNAGKSTAGGSSDAMAIAQAKLKNKTKTKVSNLGKDGLQKMPESRRLKSFGAVAAMNEEQLDEFLGGLGSIAKRIFGGGKQQASSKGSSGSSQSPLASITTGGSALKNMTGGSGGAAGAASDVVKNMTAKPLKGSDSNVVDTKDTKDAMDSKRKKREGDRLKGMKASMEEAINQVYEGKKKELSIDDQMRISKEYNRMSPEEKKKANKKAVAGIPKGKRKKDTRTDDEKMTDATGPRPGSRYRGD